MWRVMKLWAWNYSLVVWGIDNYETNSKSEEALLQLFEDLVELLKRIIEPVWDATNDTNPTVNDQK
jgi:hypothetical protein